jgi:hypothetical protein
MEDRRSLIAAERAVSLWKVGFKDEYQHPHLSSTLKRGGIAGFGCVGTVGGMYGGLKASPPYVN